MNLRALATIGAMLSLACSGTQVNSESAEFESVKTQNAEAPVEVVKSVAPEEVKATRPAVLPTPAELLTACRMDFDPYGDDPDVDAKMDAWGERCEAHSTVAFEKESSSWLYLNVVLGDGDLPSGFRVSRVTKQRDTQLASGSFDASSVDKVLSRVQKATAVRDCVADTCGSWSCDSVTLREPLAGWTLSVETKVDAKVHNVLLTAPGAEAKLVGMVPMAFQVCDGDGWCQAREDARNILIKKKGGDKDKLTDADDRRIEKIPCPMCPLPFEIRSVAIEDQQVFVVGNVIPIGHQMLPEDAQAFMSFGLAD